MWNMPGFPGRCLSAWLFLFLCPSCRFCGVSLLLRSVPQVLRLTLSPFLSFRGGDGSDCFLVAWYGSWPGLVLNGLRHVSSLHSVLSGFLIFFWRMH